MSRSLSLHELPSQRPAYGAARRLLARLLRGSSHRLVRLARRLESRERRAAAMRPSEAAALYEFHAEAGAPEGALYHEGRFVGWVAGVNRL